MKKRNFVAIFMVAIGLFASVSLFATTDLNSSDEGGKVAANDVEGVYVPD